jgi:hypothetical protein
MRPAADTAWIQKALDGCAPGKAAPVDNPVAHHSRAFHAIAIDQSPAAAALFGDGSANAGLVIVVARIPRRIKRRALADHLLASGVKKIPAHRAEARAYRQFRFLSPISRQT